VRGIGGAAGEDEASPTCASVFGDFRLAAVFLLRFGGLRSPAGFKEPFEKVGTVRCQKWHSSSPPWRFAGKGESRKRAQELAFCRH